MVAAAVVADTGYFRSFGTDRPKPVGLNLALEALTSLRRIPVARTVDTLACWRVDIDSAVRVDTGLGRHLVHIDPEHRIGSLRVVPGREHLVVVKPVDREHPADTVAFAGRRDHRRDCSH